MRANAPPPSDPAGPLARVRQACALDPRSLAAFRIALGGVLVFDLLDRLATLPALHGARGVVGRAVLPEAGETLFTAFLWSDGAVALYVAWALTFAAAVAFLGGWRARAAAIACWFLVGSLHVSNPVVVTYGDRILHALLLFGALLPLGARPSVAAARGGATQATSPWAGAAFTLQFALVYLLAGLLKTDPAWHGDANALQIVLREEYWARESAEILVTHAGGLLPWLSRAVLAFELVFPLALLVPVARVRVAALLALWAFHIGLAAFLVLGVFPFVCVAGSLALLPGAFWDRFGVRAPGGDEAKTGPPTRPFGWQDGVAVGLAILVLGANLATLAPRGLPPVLRGPLAFLELDQRWAMYAPGPARTDGWTVFAATLEGGTVVDLERGAAVPIGTPPPRPWAAPDFRWAMFVKHLRRFEEERWRTALWLCRAARDDRVERIELLFFEEQRDSWRGRGAIEHRSLATLACPPERPRPPAR